MVLSIATQQSVLYIFDVCRVLCLSKLYEAIACIIIQHYIILNLGQWTISLLAVLLLMLRFLFSSFEHRHYKFVHHMLLIGIQLRMLFIASYICFFCTQKLHTLPFYTGTGNVYQKSMRMKNDNDYGSARVQSN